MIKSMVDQGIFTINGKVKMNSNFVLKIGDILSVRDIYREHIRYDLVLRYKKNMVF
jgi:hypothetical protein